MLLCRWLDLKVCQGESPYHQIENKTLSIPIAHGEGRYYINDDGLKSLRDHGQVLFSYSENPNGSVGDIAGITNKNGNIMGMMPHPERASEHVLGRIDGLKLFQ